MSNLYFFFFLYRNSVLKQQYWNTDTHKKHAISLIRNLIEFVDIYNFDTVSCLCFLFYFSNHFNCFPFFMKKSGPLDTKAHSSPE